MLFLSSVLTRGCFTYCSRAKVRRVVLLFNVQNQRVTAERRRQRAHMLFKNICMLLRRLEAIVIKNGLEPVAGSPLFLTLC